METGKKWYLSKTIMVNIFAGCALILVNFKPEVAAVVKEYFAEAGAGWTLINVILRLVSKDKVYIA